jgi:hypothetical protein
MLEYTRSTDAEHKIKLTSEINHASWGLQQVSVGQKVPIEVYTHFVGVGSDIKITIRNKSGSRLDVIEDKINGNYFKTTYTVPDKAKEGIYFQAELPKHGLSEKSETIEVLPPRSITNLRWLEEEKDVVKKEVVRGDIVRLSADVSGFLEGTEAKFEVYEYDADGAHEPVTKLLGVVQAGKAEVAWRYDYPEDTEKIPTQEELDETGGTYSSPEYFFTINIDGVKSGEQQESGLLQFKDWVEFGLKNPEGGPMANEKFVIYFADGTQMDGKLDENGQARVENIPPGPFKLEFPDVPAFKTDDT